VTGWTIRFDGHEWSDTDVSTAHAVGVAELIGDSWDVVSPWTGPRSLAAWVAVLYGTVVGIDEAFAAVYRMPFGQLAGCITDRTSSSAVMASVA